MEFRKLISFGKTSFVMSIPKSWVTKNNLKKGDLIALEEIKNDLILSPKLDKPRFAPKEITISINKKDPDQIKRELIPAYINNNNTIILVGDELKNRAKEVRDILHNLMALEIVEQTSSKIVAKDFLNMEKISISDQIRRMDIITRDMMSDSVATFKEDKYKNIEHRDEDINRIYYLIFRAFKAAIENSEITKAYGMETEELYNSMRIAEYIEKIADETKRIARYLRKSKLSKKKQDQLISIYKEINRLFLDTMKSYHTQNKKLAYESASRKKSIVDRCDEYYEENWKERYIPNIIEKMKMMTVDIHNIGRVIYT